jgi:hypothetical protein
MSQKQSGGPPERPVRSVVEETAKEFLARKEVLGWVEKISGLKFTMRTFDSYHQQRKGPTRFKVGKHVFYKISALRDWLNSCVESGRERR